MDTCHCDYKKKHVGMFLVGKSAPPESLAGMSKGKGCLVQVGNGIELEAVGLQFEPYRWRPCGVTWDSSRTVVVIKLRRTSALRPSVNQPIKCLGPAALLLGHESRPCR